MNGDEPKSIQDIIAALKQTDALSKSFDEAEIWKEWPTVVGAELMPFGRPLGVRDGTLFIEVESSVWMHRYSYAKQSIIDAPLFSTASAVHAMR